MIGPLLAGVIVVTFFSISLSQCADDHQVNIGASYTTGHAHYNARSPPLMDAKMAVRSRRQTATKGDMGAKGDRGAPGDTGIQGFAGPTGPTGPKGVQGVTGPAGSTGARGPAGSTGPVGPVGPTGPIGIGFSAPNCPINNATDNEVLYFVAPSSRGLQCYCFSGVPLRTQKLAEEFCSNQTVDGRPMKLFSLPSASDTAHIVAASAGLRQRRNIFYFWTAAQKRGCDVSGLNPFYWPDGSQVDPDLYCGEINGYEGPIVNVNAGSVCFGPIYRQSNAMCSM